MFNILSANGQAPARTEGTLKRFYKNAAPGGVDDGWAVLLDDRGAKTPGQNSLVVPTEALCLAIVHEWQSQEDDIDIPSMPMCGFANAAIDRVRADPQVFVNQLVRFADSDLICYWADDPETLREQQASAWQPVLDWAEKHFGEAFLVTTGIIHVSQPRACLQAIRKNAETLTAFELAAMSHLASALGSVLLAFATCEGALTPEDAFSASVVDELFQADAWGEDKEAVGRRAALRQESLDAVRFMDFLKVC